MDSLLVDTNTLSAIQNYLPSNADLADMANFFSVFGDVTRLKMLSALAVDELCVSDLSTILDLNQTTVSHQLKLLRDAGMVAYRREGKIIFYRIPGNALPCVRLCGSSQVGPDVGKCPDGGGC